MSKILAQESVLETSVTPDAEDQNAPTEGDETPDFHPRCLSVIPLDLETPAGDEEEPDFHPRCLSVVPLDLEAALADERN